MTMRPSILVIAHAMCRGDTAAGDQRLERVIEQLVTFADVDFLTPEVEPASADVASRYWDVLRGMGVKIVHPRFMARLPLWCRGRLRPYDWIVVESWYPADRIAADLEAVRSESPGTRVAIDTVDVHFLRERAALERGLEDYGSEADIAERQRREIAVYHRADLVIAASQEDAQVLRTVSDRPTIVIPIVILRLPRRPGPRGNTLFFVGGFRHLPNRDGVMWFVREVYPLILMRVPDALFRIAGSHPPAEIEALRGCPGIEVLGYVADTAAWLDTAAVSVAPLRYGAGMKGKVTEALAAGVPVVTTSIGAQGLGARSGEHLHIADDAGDFAAAVVATLSDQAAAERMGLAGQVLVDSICGPAVIRRDLMAAFMSGGRSVDDTAGGIARRIMARIGCDLWIVRGWGARIARAVRRRLRLP